MKTERDGFRMLRHKQLMDELQEDSYHQTEKLADALVCPACGAVTRHGRWTWGAASPSAPRQTCPACQRIADHFPAGYVAFKGAYATAHRDQIVDIVRAREASEQAEHPLQRLMAIEENSEGIVVTTTDNRLAHRIARAVQRACRGKLVFHYNKGENLLRAVWTR